MFFYIDSWSFLIQTYFDDHAKFLFLKKYFFYKKE